ncbi:cytochrome oxidase c assembly-domain-containing protein [Pseudoneurospora amorphoporcata]|uniref:Cytochrome oxidase c assembly-domain-containing protein n=1 Tax=Pseudoneurospora amorphoporcata TaxID=241081 RepID=A0AAN6NTX4_9PEZI|nr:cytochrome oxidase c assembly-domain-containing protein [Pseudoneurospora amorphoporcata]
MAPPSNPRSVSDATRFTPTTPHASSKSADPRLNTSKSSPKEAKGIPRFVETPEQRVARLRAAHLKAKQAQLSRMDRIISGSRRFFDSAHKVTVLGLIGFTVLAGLVTAYTAADMIMFNKKRKAEFIEAQKKIEADSLEAARLAYITGKATEEQTALVEEYLEHEREAGRPKPSIFSKFPSVIGAPTPITNETTEQTTTSVSEAATWPAATTPKDTTEEQPAAATEKSGLWGWLTGSLKKEDIAAGAGQQASKLVGAVKQETSAIKEKALEAFEKEKENQRKGGPLDKVGLPEQK